MTMTTRAEAEAAAGNLGRCSRYLPATWLAFDVGDKIVAATTDGHIMANDATRSQYTYDHDLRCWKPWTILLAFSRRRRRRRDDYMSMLVTTKLLDFSEPDPHFEALRLTSGGRMQPVPSRLLFGQGDGDEVEVTSYFVAGGRVWLSVWCRCDSLDMAAPTKLGWRREGSWGGTSGTRPRPVIRHEWTKATLLPSKDEGYSSPLRGLAYLGGGRLCISWSSAYGNERMILALTAEVTMTNKESTSNGGRRKRRSRCYRLPPNNQKATVLPVQ